MSQDYDMLVINKQHTTPIGDAGTATLNTTKFAANFGKKLTGEEGSQTYARMITDPMCGAIVAGYKNPIRSCEWGIKKRQDFTPRELFVYELLQDWFFSGNSFNVLLNQVLRQIEFGFASFERIFKSIKSNKSVYILPDLQERLQTTISRIEPFPVENVKPYVNQRTQNKGLVTIDFENMAFFSFEKNGLDVRGKSILYSAYQPWLDKQKYRQLLGIGIARASNGIPLVTCPSGTKTTDDSYKAVETLLDNLRDSEMGYLILPNNWEISVFQNKPAVDQVIAAINSCNTEIAISTLMQWLLLGQSGNGGAYALGESSADFFVGGLQFIVDSIEQDFNMQVLHPTIKYNFADVDPKRFVLEGLNLNKKAGDNLAKVLTLLKNSSFVSPTREDQVYLRKLLGLPELTDDSVIVETNDTNTEENTIKLSENTNSKRQKYIDAEVKDLVEYGKSNLTLIKQKLIADIKKLMNSNSNNRLKGLKDIQVTGKTKYRQGLEKKLAKYAIDGWNEAETMANKSLKLSEPKDIPDTTLRSYAINQADTLTNDQLDGMRDKAIYTAQNGIARGYSVDQTMSNVEKVTDDYIGSNKIVVGMDLSVVQLLNYGMNFYNKSIDDELWGYEFVAVVDEKTTDICLWYNGKIFSKDSVALAEATPPLHVGCRSYMKPIYKTESQPTIDDIIAPPSIMKSKSIY